MTGERSQSATKAGSTSPREEVSAYCSKRFDTAFDSGLPDFPLQDEPFVATWESYVGESMETGSYQALSRHLVQFAFPVRQGIRESEAYRAVTLKGEDHRLFREATGLRLQHPERIELFLQQTAAGRIPVLLVPDRRDFISVVQALSQRNEPTEIPASMGACTIQGYNNWERVRLYRSQWELDYPEGDWATEFTSFRERKELYQDRFIVLSKGPYSAVAAEDIGMDETAWLEKSHIIRLQHECTHYVTRRLFGSMQNNLFDEILADYTGIVAAFGSYSADLFMRFIGLENFPEYRPDGRMENYRGKPALSDQAYNMLQQIVAVACSNLEMADRTHRGTTYDSDDLILPICALSRMSMMELADSGMPETYRRHLLGLRRP